MYQPKSSELDSPPENFMLIFTANRSCPRLDEFRRTPEFYLSRIWILTTVFIEDLIFQKLAQTSKLRAVFTCLPTLQG